MRRCNKVAYLIFNTTQAAQQLEMALTVLLGVLVLFSYCILMMMITYSTKISVADVCMYVIRTVSFTNS